MPNARTVIERSMKSKYLSDVRFSSVKGASYWPTCRIARLPQGAIATKSSVVARLAGATGAGPGGGPSAKSPAMLKKTRLSIQPASSRRARRSRNVLFGVGLSVLKA